MERTLTLSTLLLSLALLASATAAETPKGLSAGDWSSIRAAYEAGQHQFHRQEDGTQVARNPGLGWTMTFDDKGFTATNGKWTWGLELEASVAGLSEAGGAAAMEVGRCVPTAPSSQAEDLRSRLSLRTVSQRDGGGLGTTRPTLAFPRTPHLTEWFINDQRGLEQGWTLTAPAEIRLRVRGDLKASVSAQSISFGGQLNYSGLKAWDATGKTVSTHFEATAEGFAVRYDDTGAQYPIIIDPLAQNAYLKASNTGVADNFGRSVAVSGDTVVVGAVAEDSSSTGVNSRPNELAFGSGAAYVFVRSGSIWSQQAYLKARNTGAGDNFGSSVAVSGDTVVVGALTEDSSSTGVNSTPNELAGNSGAAYVFVRSGSTWSQQAYLKASNTGADDQFGGSVAVSADTVVVGAAGEDSSSTGVNFAPNELANASGAAYVFVRSGSTWSQQAYLKARNTGANDQFGGSVAVSADTVVVGAAGEDSSSTGVNSAPDELASDSGAAYVFDLGELLESLGKTGLSTVGTDLAYGAPSFGAISFAGEILFESSLLGTGSTGGRNMAMLSTVAGPVDIALQTGSIVSGLVGLPTGAKIATVTHAVHNRSASTGLFQATVIGTGIDATNNRLLFLDNGVFISPLLRTGLPIAELGGAVTAGFTDVLQDEAVSDRIALSYTLKARTGTAPVTTANDSGLLLMSHSGAIDLFNLREGADAFGRGGVFGQFGRAAMLNGESLRVIAKFIPTRGTPVDALFSTGLVSGFNLPKQGELAGGAGGARYGVFTGVTRWSEQGVVRATLTGSPTTSNEGVWTENDLLLLRKGQSIGGGLNIARILRIWGVNGFQLLAQVEVSGTGVNVTNNQALILRQLDENFLILLRTGDAAPGVGLSRVKVAALQAIDVDPINGHYAILGSLTGAAITANQALWSGQTRLGDDTTNQFQRLPKLRLQKGERYRTEVTNGDLIRSLSLKPAVDASGVGGRGLAQVVSANGQILLTITGDRAMQETVRLSP